MSLDPAPVDPNVELVTELAELDATGPCSATRTRGLVPGENVQSLLARSEVYEERSAGGAADVFDPQRRLAVLNVSLRSTLFRHREWWLRPP